MLFDRPCFPMSLRRKMNFPTRNRAEREGCSLSIACRNTARVIQRTQPDGLFACATTTPRLRHAFSDHCSSSGEASPPRLGLARPESATLRKNRGAGLGLSVLIRTAVHRSARDSKSEVLDAPLANIESRTRFGQEIDGGRHRGCGIMPETSKLRLSELPSALPSASPTPLVKHPI